MTIANPPLLDGEKTEIEMLLKKLLLRKEDTQAIFIVFNRSGGCAYKAYGCLGCISTTLESWLKNFGTDEHLLQEEKIIH